MKTVKDLNKVFMKLTKEELKKFNWFENRLSRYRYKIMINYCAKLIPQNSKVLELGCGHGYVSAMLKILRPDINILTTDCISNSSIHSRVWELLRKEFEFKFKFEDGTNLSFDNNSFDVVISFGVMEHADNPAKFLSEVYRVLKIEGLNIMFNLPNRYSLNDFMAKMLNQKGHDIRYTKKEVRNTFRKKGFKNIKVRRDSFIPAQTDRVNIRFISDIFNKHFKTLNKIDSLLLKTPLSLFSQAYSIIAKK
jgi:ubiquinone/menaquinone biosynthesis C-methylase UbiE